MGFAHFFCVWQPAAANESKNNNEYLLDTYSHLANCSTWHSFSPRRRLCKIMCKLNWNSCDTSKSTSVSVWHWLALIDCQSSVIKAVVRCGDTDHCKISPCHAPTIYPSLHWFPSYSGRISSGAARFLKQLSHLRCDVMLCDAMAMAVRVPVPFFVLVDHTSPDSSRLRSNPIWTVNTFQHNGSANCI